MKERLRKLLSVLCAAVLLCGCLSLGAAADGAGSSTVTVVWNDENQASLRPSLDATLTVGDSQHTVTLNAGNNWTATLSGLKEAGTWAVEAPEGFTKSVFEKDGRTVVTLTRQTEKVSVQVTQRWEDQDNVKGVRPQSVSVRLLADGKPYQAAVPLNSGNSWTTTFKDLPKYRQGTKEAIAYTVEPANKTVFYDTAVTGSQDGGYVLTSTLQTGTLKVKASFPDGLENADWSALKIVISGPEWDEPLEIGYADLPYESPNVLAGSYVAQEKNPGNLVEGYMLDAGASVTVKSALVPAGGEGTAELKNVYQPLKPEEELTGDGTDADLSKLQFRIEGPDPTMPMTVEYSQFSDGKFELEGLEPGTYVVYELNAGTLVDSFELTSNSTTGVAITVSDGGSATVKPAKLFNQYQPMTPAPTPEPTPTPEVETIEVPVTKTWEDEDDKDGNRPVTVTVRLFANGEPADVAALNAANEWKFTFTDLAKYDKDGNEIVYTISEDAVPWYDSQVDGYHLTNVYHPETTSVSVRKVWNDNNNKSRMRPAQIRAYLSNGMSVILNAANGWQATIDNLPTKLNGQTAVYTWSEKEVLGYTMTNYEVNGSETVITNSLYRKPGGPGEPYLIIEEYGTPLGIEVIINHVGDCYD